MKLDGEIINSVPEKSELYSVAVDCGDTAIGEWDYDSWGVKINDLNKTKVKCGINFHDLSKNLIEVVKLGDYVEMTPTSTSYAISHEDTGCSGYTDTSNYCNSKYKEQTINPSELNLWRVINIKDDGKIELISERLPSKILYFYGETGYKNLVGVLNKAAKQYENEKYTIGSRSMGYNGQTEYLTISTFYKGSNWSGTSNNDYESQGGGDMLYEQDLNLVKNALTYLTAETVGTPLYKTDIWLASRHYYHSYSYRDIVRWYGRIIRNGSLAVVTETENTYDNALYYYGNDSAGTYSSAAESAYLRPIIVLKPGLKVIGSGTSEDHYKFID